MADRLLDIPDVAQLLKLNPGDVGRLIHSGRLPAKKLIAMRGTGTRPRLRILQSALDEFIHNMPDAATDEMTIEPSEPAPRRRAPIRGLTPAKVYY
jgi:hypothetical protein